MHRRRRRAHNFYPRPPRGGRHRYGRPESSIRRISIHALREEGDRTTRASESVYRNFYPRPPRGGRPAEDSANRILITFLSTPSARRATKAPAQSGKSNRISIHALREEGDVASTATSPTNSPFLSTPSARRATKIIMPEEEPHVISIHALREEGDQALKRKEH